MAAGLAFDERQNHLVGGAGASVSLSSGTAVDLTWPLVCVRYEAAVCYRLVVPHEFNSLRKEKLLLVFLKKNQTHLLVDLLSIPRSGGKKCQNV